MRIPAIVRLSFLLLLALLGSCDFWSNKVKVSYRNFEETVELQQNLVFKFNHDLVDDTLLDLWSDEQYIRFSPEVKGKFKWNDNNELVFSPDFKFLPSTEYKAELTEKLLMHLKPKGKYKLDSEEAEFKFHTPYLDLSNVNAYWSKHEGTGQVGVRMELQFNYKVDPNEVAKLLKLRAEGQELNFDMQSNAVTEAVQITIWGHSTSLDAKEYELNIAPGLHCQESKYVSTKPLTFKGQIPSKDDFTVLGIETLFNEDIAFLNVSTNQELTEQNINDLIKLDPEISFSTERHNAGFYIRAQFEEGSSYEITISKELKGMFGSRLKEDYKQTVVIGKQRPHISFSNRKGIYLTSKGEKNVGIKLINVPKVKVKVYKIYANNLQEFFRDNGMSGYYDYYEEQEYYYYERSYYGLEDVGDVVLEKEYESKALQKSSGAHLLNLDFKDINAFKGIYVVQIESTQDRWVRASKVVSISDIGLIVKQAGDNIHVFANSIASAQAMSGVAVTLVSSNNQSIQKGSTDENGVAIFKDISKKAPGFKVNLITCQLNEDFNYLSFNQNRVETSQFDIGGAFSNTAGYDAFLYGDREIYRPGEIIYLNTIVRNKEYLPLSNVPVKMKMLLPNGEEFSVQKGTLNKEGAWSSKVQLPANCITGTYIAEIYTTNDILLSSKSISVEEFMPDRIKVNAELNKKEALAYQLNEELQVNATALNLFGPPAANRNYEMELSLTRKYFRPKGLDQYTFNLEGTSYNSFESVERQGTTNDAGLINEKFQFDPAWNGNGILSGKVFITVFDETGRPVHKVKQFDLLTQQNFYGIKYFDYYVGTRQNLTVPLAVVNADGKGVTASAEVQVLQFEWQTVLENNYGSYRYVSQRKSKIVYQKTVTLSGTSNSINFLPSTSGEYEIRVSQPGAKGYVSRSFYAYSWGSTDNSSFEVSNEGNIIIEASKDQYNVGDKANLLFKTPFDGKILVTLERDKVLEYHYLNTQNKSAMLEVELKENHLPNIYVSATLIKAHSKTSMPLTVAHGYLPIKVEKQAHRLPVQIIAPEKCRSNTQQKICIKTKPMQDIEVTIAVVDEGILQLKDTKSPDPYAHFFRRKALEVSSYDIYNKLLPELGFSNRSSSGGDGYNMDKRANPLANRRIKLMAYWSGILKTNANGEACYTIDIPKFSGELRIMAVVWKGNSFGSGEKPMKVADPIVISTALPRFMSPSDTVLVPVTITNTTDKNAGGETKITVKGPVSIIGNNTQRINVKANSETVAYFKVAAQPQIGNATITASVNALNEDFKEPIEITVRPPSSLLKRSGSGQIAANNTGSIDMGTNWIPSSVSGKLVISRSPLIQFADNLDYLVGYPHGCLEQTVSRAFPQLYFSDIVKAAGISNTSGGDPHYYVNEAIRKLTSMQLHNGSLSYWPGGYRESWWGSVYAAHFMIEADKAGYEVDRQLLNRIYGYLEQKVKEKNFDEYHYYDNAGVLRIKQIAPQDIFYSLYVLARTGRKDLSTMNYWKSNMSLLTLDSRYLLASTYFMLGDMNSYKQVLPSAFEGEKAINGFGGSFYSYVRDMSISLNTLLDTDPNSPQVPVIAQHLTAEMKRRKWMSTQEQAWGFIALGRLARKVNESTATATVTIDGKTIATYDGKGSLKLTNGLSNKKVNIEVKGSGALYYFWVQEGLSADGKVKEEDNYLRVRKQFYDKHGNLLTGNNFKQNDLVVVKLTVVTTDNSTVENVVVTDMLPAGFEVENPRLSEQAGMPWIKSQAIPEHFDIRDDRINMFTTVGAVPKTFYYTVRAVSPGTYVMGPVSADAMYNGEYHSYNGAGVIKISVR